jgi:hypothetical protein
MPDPDLVAVEAQLDPLVHEPHRRPVEAAAVASSHLGMLSVVEPRERFSRRWRALRLDRLASIAPGSVAVSSSICCASYA